MIGVYIILFCFVFHLIIIIIIILYLLGRRLRLERLKYVMRIYTAMNRFAAVICIMPNLGTYVANIRNTFPKLGHFQKFSFLL